MKALAEDIRSMRIEMSMKDMGIERTVANIKKSFNTLKSEINSSNKEFTYGEKSIDSYKKHISQLEQAQEASEKNLKEMTREYHKVGDAQGYASNEALGLQKSISEQEKELGFLKRELDSANKGLEQFKKNQAIDNSSFTKIGKSFQNIGNDITSISQKMGEVGTSLTNKITKPAVIAGGALGAMVGKLGFDRLVSLDTAQAKLKGLGYSAKEVGTITDQVTEAVKGTTIKLGEGVDIAAGGLAAGVKEGKDLEKYIQLVGSAAVGSGRDVGDMATIFNRVQGQGKLMTEELNSVEDGMSGFSQAMAKDMGVSLEEFREKVSAGEVSSEQFMSTMDTFAGKMSKEYAKSWQGLVSNTKAYIGQIGEGLLSGTFQQAKGSLREFEDIMQSDSIQKWADETGIKLANAFTTIANGIKSVIGWWKSLDGSTQQTLGSLAKYAGITLVAVGPLLKVFSMLGKAVGGIFGPFGKFLGFLGKVGPEAKTAGSLLGGITNIAPKLGAVLGALTGPVGLTVAAIVGLGTALVIAYKKSETFRNIVNGAFEGVVNGAKALWAGIKVVLDPIINAFASFGREISKSLGQFWQENGPQFMEALNNIKTGFMAMWTFIKPLLSGIGSLFKGIFGGILSFIQFMMPAIQGIFKSGWAIVKYIITSTWEAIKGVITGALDMIMGVVKVFIGLFTGDFSKMWEGIKQIFFGALKFVWNLVQLWFVGKIFGLFKAGLTLIKGVVSGSLNGVKGTFSTVLNAIWGIVKKIFTSVSNFTKAIFNGIWKFTKAIWSNIKLAVTNPVKLIQKIVPQTFRMMSKIVKSIFSGLQKAVSVIFKTLKTVVVNIAKALSNALRGNFSGMKKNLQNITTSLKNAVVKLWQILKKTVVNVAKSLWSGIKGIFNSLFKTAKNITQNIKNSVVDKWKSLKKSVVNLASGAKDGVVKGFKAMYDKGVEWLNKLKNFIKKAKDGFKKVATSLGKGVANGAISGLNAMIDGINSLSKKIMKKKLIKKSIPKLSTGTDANPGVKTDSQGRLTKGTKAIVNDKGIGNGKGPNGHKELIYRRSGKIEQPRGNNKKVSLKRGDGVINGARSKSLMPHLSKGTIKDELFGAISGGANKVKDTASKGFHKAKDAGTSLIEGGKDLAGKAKKAFDKAIGDVMEYVKNPMKLVDKTMKFFGVDFSNVTGEAMSGTMDFGYKGLKNSVKDLIAGWFDELEGGDGDSGWLLKHDILQTFGNYTGGLMFNGGKHYGVDFGMPTGTSIKALTDGTVTQAGAVAGGGGNQITIKEPGGKWYQWYMHLMNGGVKAKKGQKVEAGDEIGKSGSTGNSTTPHLHIQRMKGYPSNETAVDPMKWLKSLKGGSQNKSASKWKSDIRKAAKEMGVSVSKSDVNGIASLINAESGGDPKITQQIQDINSGGNEAQGLLQYVPSTFKDYAKKGHTNIKSGYDQLLAFFNNKNWKSDYNPNGGWGPTGARKFATGGIIRTDGLYNLAEDGHEEVMMSMDPKRATDTMKLMGYVQENLRGKDNNKRPNQVPNRYGKSSSTSNSREIELMAQQIERQDETIDVLKQMLSAVMNIEKQPKGTSERNISKQQGKKAIMESFNSGGAFV
mgnify:CR=1 FL=1